MVARALCQVDDWARTKSIPRIQKYGLKGEHFNLNAFNLLGLQQTETMRLVC